MIANVGKTDSFIRYMIGVALLLNITILETGTVGTVILLALGLINLYTAYRKSCPMYNVLNISTAEKEASGSEESSE